MAGWTFEILVDGHPLAVDVDEAVKTFAVSDSRGDLVGTGNLHRPSGRIEVKDGSTGITDAVVCAIEIDLNDVVSGPAAFPSSGR